MKIVAFILWGLLISWGIPVIADHIHKPIKDYAIAGDPLVMPNYIGSNVSASCVDPIRGSIYAIDRVSNEMFEYHWRNMRYIRTMKTTGLGRLTGCGFIQENIFVFGDQSSSELVVVEIGPTRSVIKRSDALRIIRTDPLLKPGASEKVIVGVSYDTMRGVFYVAVHSSDAVKYGVWRVNERTGKATIYISDKRFEAVQSDDKQPFAKDLSDLYFDQATGRLFVLSAGSARVNEFDTNGGGNEFVAKKDLTDPHSGCDIEQQPKGLGITHDLLVVTSEPKCVAR